MFQLNKLTSKSKKRKKIGRGGSRGGSSGRGTKGQKARSGGRINASFEGGQMPLTRRMPKRGFNNKRFKKEYIILNLASLDRIFKDSDQVDREVLIKKGLIKREGNLLYKILGSGKLSKKLIVTADAFSESAKKAILDVGGEVKLTEEN